MKKLAKQVHESKIKAKFKDKKPLFSNKEIIFRSEGLARVFTISSRMQLVFLCVLMFIASWSFYSYYIYNRSGNIISNKNQEIGETREAYVDLMTEFVSLHKNMVSVISSFDGTNKNSENTKIYQTQAQVVEDKIKSIIVEKQWGDTSRIDDKITVSDALLQRDIVVSERDVLREHLKELLNDVDDIKKSELEVLKRVEQVAGKEMAKIKGAITSVNKPLKAQSLYFNPLANKKNDSKGGPYVPADINLKDKNIFDKTSAVFKDLETLEYYKEVIQYVPIGKPVWSYWVSSPFGYRSDPFKSSKAAHKGIDLASRKGNKVKSMAKGKVVQGYFSTSYGNLIVIDHGNGFKTKYAHLHKSYVKKGQEIEAGDTIGEVGSTGRSTGPHLHYEIIYRGKHVDPLPFIKTNIS